MVIWGFGSFVNNYNKTFTCVIKLRWYLIHIFDFEIVKLVVWDDNSLRLRLHQYKYSRLKIMI